MPRLSWHFNRVIKFHIIFESFYKLLSLSKIFCFIVLSSDQDINYTLRIFFINSFMPILNFFKAFLEFTIDWIDEENNLNMFDMKVKVSSIVFIVLDIPNTQPKSLILNFASLCVILSRSLRILIWLKAISNKSFD